MELGVMQAVVAERRTSQNRGLYGGTLSTYPVCSTFVVPLNRERQLIRGLTTISIARFLLRVSCLFRGAVVSLGCCRYLW